MIFLAGCDYSTPEKQDGFFFNTFVQPMKHLLQWLGNDVFHNNFGLAIIVLVLFIRLILLPFMLSNYKNSHMMREKMKVAKPEVDGIQEKVKRARTQEEKMAANQELMEVYKKYDMNPMKSMLGCLPILIQMPIIMGLYFVLKDKLVNGLSEHPHFLWFNLTKPDIWITVIAGCAILYSSCSFKQNDASRATSDGLYDDGYFSNNDYLDFFTSIISFRFILVCQCIILSNSNAFC